MTPASVVHKLDTVFTFADLFAGIGGFHATLSHAGGRCVYVSEIDTPARSVYEANWVTNHDNDDAEPPSGPVLNADINTATPVDQPLVEVPEHIDVLTAGFPCQPFSKSGGQRGMDETRGTLFFNIARVLEERTPSVILLENVRNLTGPRHLHEWQVIIRELRRIGYRVSATPSVFSPHLLPPDLGGTPQVRDRVFILGTYVGPERSQVEVAPTLVRGPVQGWEPMNWDISWALDDEDTIANLHRYDLTQDEREWIDAWDDLVIAYRKANNGKRLPGFPLWADHWMSVAQMEQQAHPQDQPAWKSDFLYKNARFYETNRSLIDTWRRAHLEFEHFPASRRKLEWQAQDVPSLWDTVMHLRPSGIRAKAPTYLPALVAITQTSIIGTRQRRITPHEGARLQGMPRTFTFGDQRDSLSYRQLGNGVSVGAAWHALRTHVERDQADIPDHVSGPILAAPLNPSPDALKIPDPASVQEASPEPVRA